MTDHVSIKRAPSDGEVLHCKRVMSGSIYRAAGWDNDYELQFIAVSPMGDEIMLYQTDYHNPNPDSPPIKKVASRAGLENISCSGYSPIRPGISSVGSLNGAVSIFDINEPSFARVLSPKQRRPCNAISFNYSRDIIAAGFDKGRQDNSLQFWDIESSMGSMDHSTRPLSTYITNEAVLTTAFYPHEDNSLLCGSYKFLREIDLRQEQPSLQLATKYTLGLEIDPFRPFLFMSHSEDGFLGVWDRRKLTTNSPNTSKGMTGSAAQELPVLQFAKLLNDQSVRKIQTPCLRYSTVRRGEFATVFNGELIRRWNTGIVPAVSEPSSISQERNQSADGVVQSLKSQASDLYNQIEDSPFVHLILDTKTDYERVISFDYARSPKSSTLTNFVCMRQSGLVFLMSAVECLESMHFNSFNDLVISGSIGTYTKFNLEQSFSDKAGAGPRATNHSAFDDRLQLEESVFISDARSSLKVDGTASLYENNDSESMLDDESAGTPYLRTNTRPRFSSDFDGEIRIPINILVGADSILANDICATIRKRAQLNYGVDCIHNLNLLEKIDSLNNHLNLRNTWRWLSLAKKSLDKGTMISEGLDLGYQGVWGIWKGVEELNDQECVIAGESAQKMKEPITDSLFLSAVRAILAAKGKKMANISMPNNSERKSQRILCLVVSGWYMTEAEFDEKLELLKSKGQIEKAAGWSVFLGRVDKAIDILASSKSERFRLMLTAVAGYLAYKSSNTNSPWKDQCRKMASELENPYLRAIFAFIADNDWWDVLDEHSLPLRERLGVALRFLSDKDLDVYLNRIKENVVSRGELEGLILTGITPLGFDLLQSYVDRTSDVQTAALLSAFACPRYFSDDRAKHWVDCYRSLLNSWGMFGVRAKFDGSRTKLSKTTTGQITLKSAPKQVYLQCLRCNKNISKPKLSILGSGSNAGQSANNPVAMKQFNKLSGNSNVSASTEDIIACPFCGMPLPRCSICLLTLGASIMQPVSYSMHDLDIATRIDYKFKEMSSFCLSCGHGCHAQHAEEWFSKHYVCPVPDCDCHCNSK